MDFGTVLASGVVAALVSGLVAIKNSERKILIENVTQERTKWREKIRTINDEVQNAFLEKDEKGIQILRSRLRLLLNPIDPMDCDIILDLKTLEEDGATQEKFDRFSIKLSLLLKHDWERVKREAVNSIFRQQDAVRLSYDEYLRTANKCMQRIAEKAGTR